MNQFNVGDKVKAVGFVDCFGKTIPERSGLTVKTVRRIDYTNEPIHYYRLLTVWPNGFDAVEGAERFFELDQAASR